jgi:hypothetical protein
MLPGRVGIRRAIGLLTIGMVLGSTPALGAQGETVRISAPSGAEANGLSDSAAISADGRFVVFRSAASNLVPGDSNARDDLFRYDRSTGNIRPVTVTAAGGFLQASHGEGAISGTGRYVAFWSLASFEANDPTRTTDLFVKDMDTGVIERVSRAPDGSFPNSNDRFSPDKPAAISDDGRWVVFESSASNLVAGDVDDQAPDIYAHDRQTGTTMLLSTEETGQPGPSTGSEALLAGSGNEAVVTLRIASGDRTTRRLVVHHLDTGMSEVLTGIDPQRTRVVAIAAGGASAVIVSANRVVPDFYDVVSNKTTPLTDQIDWTGVKPSQFTPNLGGFVGPTVNAFTFRVVDRESGQFTELPRGIDGAAPNQDVIPTSLSDDGTVVTFETSASNLTGGDTNGVADVFAVRIAKGTFADDDGNPFEADIEWLAAEGITKGCGIELFCPRAAVTREQMASFLSRALGLPPVAQDFFSDDTGSPHEDDVNALAAAGITKGCGSDRFCPEDFVSREEMASFLVRALGLPPSTIDFFLDDAGSIHAADIDSIAQAEITLGCGPGLFCPHEPVLREQMAAFLHRAFG